MRDTAGVDIWVRGGYNDCMDGRHGADRDGRPNVELIMRYIIWQVDSTEWMPVRYENNANRAVKLLRELSRRFPNVKYALTFSE